MENMEAVNRQLATKSGPAYNLYQKRQAAGMERYMRKLHAGIDLEARRLESE